MKAATDRRRGRSASPCLRAGYCHFIAAQAVRLMIISVMSSTGAVVPTKRDSASSMRSRMPEAERLRLFFHDFDQSRLRRTLRRAH